MPAHVVERVFERHAQFHADRYGEGAGSTDPGGAMGDDRTTTSKIVHDRIEQTRLGIDWLEIQIRNRKPGRARGFLEPTDVVGVAIFDLEPLHQADHAVCSHLVEDRHGIRSNRMLAAEPQAAVARG